MARLPLVALVALLALGACAGPRPPACAPGTGAPVTVFTLYFGQAVAGRNDVTAEEWRGFVDDTVTANLPNGYTLADASGAWMNPMTRGTIHEATKVLTVALPGTPDSLAAVDRIRNEYQVRFRQQLVGMTMQAGCGAF